MNLRLKKVIGFATLAATVSPISDALAQEGPLVVPDTETAQMQDWCLLNSETQEGFMSFAVAPSIADILMAIHGNVFTPLASEVCADGKDNDCDGQVDEGCSEGRDPKLELSRECDACLQNYCPESVADCEAQDSCIAGISCVAQKRCMDPVGGDLTCICDVIYEGCMDDGSRQGPCGKQLMPPEPRNPFWPSLPIASRSILFCMTLNCTSKCSENFRDAT